MNILIKNALTLLEDGNGFRLETRDICIEGNTITKVAPAGSLKCEEAGEAAGKAYGGGAGSNTAGKGISGGTKFEKIINASGKLVMPGLINAHTHAYMSLFRNFADDQAFWDWLSNVQSVETGMTAEDCYWGTLLNAIEMIKTGTTCFVDMNIVTAKGTTDGPASACAGAAAESGMRALITRGLVGSAEDESSKTTYANVLTEMELFKNDKRVKFGFGPHAPYSCMADYLQKIVADAKKMHMGQTIHLSESLSEVENMEKEHGMTPIQYVDSLGIFEIPTIAAHCVQATKEDICIMAEKNVSVAINPKSNMKLGNGFAPVEEMLEAGVNVCLGTDGCGSNNTQNMFAEMNTAALVYKGAAKKAQCISAEDVLKFATVNGAKALGMEGRLGTIKEGALADIIILDINEPEFYPSINIISGLVYSATGREVETVIIDGEPVMENRKLLTIDENLVYTQCEFICDRLKMFGPMKSPSAL